MIDNLKYASLIIPTIIYDASDIVNRNANIVRYKVDIQLNKSFLFYSELFTKPNEWIEYDYFNFISLTYDEILMYIFYARQFDTLLKGKLTDRINKVIYIP
jgi:hypothetical protein